MLQTQISLWTKPDHFNFDFYDKSYGQAVISRLVCSIYLLHTKVPLSGIVIFQISVNGCLQAGESYIAENCSVCYCLGDDGFLVCEVEGCQDDEVCRETNGSYACVCEPPARMYIDSCLGEYSSRCICLWRFCQGLVYKY